MQIWREAAEPLGLWQLACVSFVHIPFEEGISDLLGGSYMNMSEMAKTGQNSKHLADITTHPVRNVEVRREYKC